MHDENPSPSETLRRAADLMREQHGPDHKRHEMWSAMAAWLYSTVSMHRDCKQCLGRFALENPCAEVAHATVIARAYLGGAA